MEVDNKSENHSLIDTIWQLLPTDPIAAYAKSGHPFAQYYYLRRNIHNAEISLAEKVLMMRNVMAYNVMPDLMNYFTLSEFYYLNDALIIENLFALPLFAEKLGICTEPEIFCRIFFLYCIYLQNNHQYLDDNFMILMFANYLEKIAQPLIFEEIIDIIEHVCPRIVQHDLNRIYRIIYRNESETQLTLHYLLKTPGVTDIIKVGNIDDLAQINTSEDAEQIALIWHRCCNEGYIKHYDCLVALAMIRYSRDRQSAVELIHQEYPHLLYENIHHYRVEIPEFSLLLLTDPTHLCQLSPAVLVEIFRGPFLANWLTNTIKIIFSAIIRADLPQNLHCELLFQILNHIKNEPDELFSTVLCDIKLLLEIQTEYQSRLRYFAFLSNQLFSQHALATKIISTIEKNIVLTRLCAAIPNFNELIIEFAVIEKNQQKHKQYQPKTVFDENNHQPEFLKVDVKIQPSNQIKITELSSGFTKIMPDPEIIPNSPAYREIKPRNFPEHFKALDSVDPKECLASIQRLFLGKALSFFKTINDNITRVAVENTHQSTEPLHLIRGLLANSMKQQFTLIQLQEFCLTKLIALLPATDIDKLLDGQQSTLANQTLFALVEILKLPYPLVSYYFNARYEYLQHLNLYHHNESTDTFNF